MGETQNLVDVEQKKAAELKKELVAWFSNYPLVIKLDRFTN